MTKIQLKQIAKQLNIRGYKHMKKHILAEKIEAKIDCSHIIGAVHQL